MRGEARGASTAGRSVVEDPNEGRLRGPRRRLVTVVEMPGVFSVISSFSFSTAAAAAEGAFEVVEGVGRVRLTNGDGRRDGLSDSSLTMAFEDGVTTVLRDGNLDLKVEASLTASGRLTVDVRNRDGRVGRDRPGMKVLLVFTSETTTLRVVSLDSVVDWGDPRVLNVLMNLRWPGVVVSTSAVLTLYTVVYSLVRSLTVVSVRSDVGSSVAISLTSSASLLLIVSCAWLRTFGPSRTMFVIGVSTTVPLVIFGSLSWIRRALSSLRLLNPYCSAVPRVRRMRSCVLNRSSSIPV